MKYLGFLLFLLSFNGFGQEEILLQTNPDDRYVITYTVNGYVLHFSYNDVLEMADDAEAKNSLKAYFDAKISTDQKAEINTEKTIATSYGDRRLDTYFGSRKLSKLIGSGNFMILDLRGKSSINSLTYEIEKLDKSYETTYFDAQTGVKIFSNKIRYANIVNPVF